ncbi:MAG: bifunctional diaminohydroxyphosphoribosylaminopyrimidine deaminase/5-amino-6-(5-phosphoribosylamino)uracil reductase RibD [Gemmatimonadota bacterium]
MGRALALAERGGGATAPNPMVGCVIAGATGDILGEGWHARAGGPHAEVAALAAAAAAGRDVRGATAVVTLEPCAHEGQTPPCAERLRGAGIARVVYATPDPWTGKGGADRLRAAGVEVVDGVGGAGARRLNEPWFHFIATGRPFIHVKVAQTLNGRVTRGAGEERWITGDEARQAVHRLRRRHRAILVGSGTVLADDPLLTVREWPPADPIEGDAAPDVGWPDVQPIRIVLDSSLRTPPGSRLLASAAQNPVWLLCGDDLRPGAEDALVARGADVVRVARGGRGLDLGAALEVLAARDVTGVLVEAGPTLAAALLAEGLVDRWTAFVSPDRAEAADAQPLFPDAEPFLELDAVEWTRHGRDAAVTGRPARAF